MTLELSDVLSVLSLLISSAVAIITARFIVPKYYDVQRRIMKYDAGLIVELYDFKKEKLNNLNALLHHYNAEASVINEDFGNGVFYCKIIVYDNKTKWTYRDIRSAIASSDLCTRVFVTKNGTMHDRLQTNKK